MATIGSFGGVKFTVSDKTLLTFSDFTRNKESRWQTINVIGGKPRKEFEGPGLEKITFSVLLSASLNVNPDRILKKWLEMLDKGRVSKLLLKNRPVGNTYFSLEAIAVDGIDVDNRGNVWKQRVSLTLEEYPKKAKAPKKKSVKKKKSTAKTKKDVAGTMIITTKSVHIRSGPGVSNKVLGYALKGNELTVYRKVNGWYALGNGKYITADASYSKFEARKGAK
ncbi:phage tail protein [Viridibacillus sp. FSL R5-0468]|uniref:phage tail protein n=1 Tax=Viridibacillus sp. FSL R5-0468 TaxID=2921640 RepID=UPI0030F766CA